jgi:glycogen operon protein
MLLAGDECRRTQDGNNNAYCQDNAISWFDWNLVGRNADLLRFCRGLIAFRKQQPTIRRATFLEGKPVHPELPSDVIWFDPNGAPVQWGATQRSLGCLLAAWPAKGRGAEAARHVLLLMHAGDAPSEFDLPEAARRVDWRLFVNTAAESPADLYPQADGPPVPPGGKLTLLDRSLLCFVAAGK